MGSIKNGYCVDIALCIDATKSMEPILDEVKKNVLTLYEQFLDALEIAGKSVEALRVRVIAFRDCKYDREAILASDFFDLPEQSGKLEAFVRGIQPIGGGDLPENALEALALAMKSDWTVEGTKRRHAIVLFTDAAPLPLGERAGCPGYPADMPASVETLSAMWEGIGLPDGCRLRPASGRLIAFVPNDPEWHWLESWNRCVVDYTGGRGCSETKMDDVLNTVVGSFG